MKVSTNEQQTKKTTLSDQFLYMETPELRRALEEHRLAWEKENGPIDLSRNYSCLLPAEMQRWLLENDTKRYFDGLPEFAQQFLRGVFDRAATRGKLDFGRGPYLRLYLSGGMAEHREGRSR